MFVLLQLGGTCPKNLPVRIGLPHMMVKSGWPVATGGILLIVYNTILGRGRMYHHHVNTQLVLTDGLWFKTILYMQ